jgi:hypothetical protein
MSDLKYKSLEELELLEIDTTRYITRLKGEIIYHDNKAKNGRQRMHGQIQRLQWIRKYIGAKKGYQDKGSGI